MRTLARLVGMNTSVFHYAQAQQQAAAIRDAYRNPPRPQIEVPPVPEKPGRFAHFVGRVTQPFHRGVAAPAS
jgi:hypothetical protein